MAFRKSFKLLPGVKINVSPSGFSTTVGGVNIDHRKRRKNTGQQPDTSSNSGCLWVVGGAAVLIIAFFAWLLSVTGGPYKYRHPVVVTGSGVRIRQYSSSDDYSKVIGAVAKGDTLELQSIDKDGWCGISLALDSKNKFNNETRSGYIKREFVSIPDSTIKAADKDGFIK